MKKKKLKKSVLILIIVIIIAIIGVVLFNILNTKKDVVKKEVTNVIEGYDYKLYDSDASIYKDMFKNLKSVLEADTINEEEYASLVSKMFVYSFYNLDDKISKNDIGGVEFVYPTNRTNFVDEAINTTYKYIEHNLYGKRDQELPIIDDITVEKVSKVSFKYTTIEDKKEVSKTDDEAYEVNVNIVYKKDLGYPTSVVVKLVHLDKYLYVVYMK